MKAKETTNSTAKSYALKMRESYKKYLPEVQTYMDALLDNLVETDRLKGGDIVAIDILASALQTWRLSLAEVQKYGITLINDRHNRTKNPAIDVGNAALRQATGILQEYGFTAMSRKKLEKREKQDEEPEDDSPLANFLKNQLDNPG